MDKYYYRIVIAVLVLPALITMFCGCGKKKDIVDTIETTEQSELPESESEAVEKLSDEQALSAIRKYCYIINPDLQNIVEAKEYPVYWEIASSDEDEIVILYRSYTGAQNRYYIDRTTGETEVTEYVPEITDKEQITDERFNVRDYL